MKFRACDWKIKILWNKNILTVMEELRKQIPEKELNQPIPRTWEE
jgi:hypothetical protein